MKKILALIMALVICVSTLASCGNKTNEALDSAIDYIFQMYKDDAESTPKDYDVIAKVPVGNDEYYDVTWTVDVEEGVTVKESSKEGFVTIDVNETTPTEIPYVLTATVTDPDGNTATKDFNRKVPAYELNTYDDYAAAADEDPLTVQGIVTGIMSKADGDKENSVFLQDANGAGGYYVYGLEQDPAADLKIKVGMTVEAAGVKKNYNGTHELVSATLTVIKSETTAVTPVDYTETFKKADKTEDAALIAKQALLVTIKGVEITEQETSNGYYKFKLDGVEAYLRISSSSNCTTKAEAETIKKNHTEKKGYTADVTGLVSVYNGAFYLIPVSADAFSNFKLAEKSPADQITHEIAKISIAAKYSETKEITLPLKGTDFAGVTFTYTVEGNCLAFDAATGKLTIKADATDKTGKVKVVAKNAGATDVTKEFAIEIVEGSSIFVALSQKDGETVTVTGVVSKVSYAWNDEYGNMTCTIVDDNGYSIDLYRTKVKCDVGDVVTVTGALSTYNGARQLAQDSTGEKVGTITDAYKAAIEFAGLKIETSYSADVDVTLPTNKTAYDATIVWTKDDAAITKLTVAQTEEAQEITLKVSVTVGSATLTRDVVVKISAKAPDGATTAKVVIADYATAKGWTNGTQYATVELDANITVTATGGQNTGKYYDNGTNWRIYQGETPTVKIEAKNGKTIVSVKITYLSEKTGVLTQGTTQIESDTVVAVNATSITFSVGNTAEVTNGQVRITAIEVVYA